MLPLPAAVANDQQSLLKKLCLLITTSLRSFWKISETKSDRYWHSWGSVSQSQPLWIRPDYKVKLRSHSNLFHPNIPNHTYFRRISNMNLPAFKVNSTFAVVMSVPNWYPSIIFIFHVDHAHQIQLVWVTVHDVHENLTVLNIFFQGIIFHRDWDLISNL